MDQMSSQCNEKTPEQKPKIPFLLSKREVTFVELTFNLGKLCTLQSCKWVRFAYKEKGSGVQR